MSKYKIRPWLNDDGTMRPDSELRELGKSWTAQQWNNYLDEVTGTPPHDALEQTTCRIDFISPEEGGKIYDSMSEKVRVDMLDEEIEKLSEIERKVIQLTFWEDMNTTKAAEALGMNRGQAWRVKKRALKKIKTGMSCRMADFNINKMMRKIYIKSKSKGGNDGI